MYYIEKQGVHGHGVMDIGFDLDEMKAKADYLDEHDIDDYHEYVVCSFAPARFIEDIGWIDGSEVVYTGGEYKEV